MACCLVVFYFVPLDRENESGFARLLVFLLAFGGLLAVLGLQTRRQLAARRNPTVRVQSVLGLVAPIIVFFALAYYWLELHDADQFAGLHSRTDALYFAVVTLGTVGYGDIHPTGDAARVVTMVQIVFDLAVIGVLVGAATSKFRERVEHLTEHPHAGARAPGGNRRRGASPR